MADGGGDRVLATFRPDAARYLRAHVVMALAGGVAAGLVLVALGNPHPWVGPVAGLLAIGLRGLYLRSEAMAEVWHLTALRLTGPGGRVVPLSALAEVRLFAGTLILVTRAGEKHQMRYLADPADVRARILAAQQEGRP